MATKAEEMVTVMVPGRSPKDCTPVPVTINGYRRLVPVNKPVKVPASVAEVLSNRSAMLSKAVEYDAVNAK